MGDWGEYVDSVVKHVFRCFADFFLLPPLLVIDATFCPGLLLLSKQGNQRFRKLVSARAEDYAAASTRTDKTFIVCSIVSEVRKAAPKGGFVKKDSTTGRWYEVGDFNAHEKTSQMFRDVLHESYLSSNKSKKKRRDLFRTNSKKRMITMQQPTLNASAGRYLRGNVARHHSYGSVKRAVGTY